MWRLISATLVLLAAVVATAAPVPPPAWACSSVWSPAGPPTTACADSTCNPRQVNLGGDLLVLSIGSLSYTKGGFNPTGSSTADCCTQCKAQDGCNTWVFCNQKEGCGPKGSCTAYVNSLPKVSGPPSSGSWMVFPIKGFGQFGACGPEGRWPNQMCSYKLTADPAKPVVIASSGPDAAGWVSGVVVKATQPGCPIGLTAATCKACMATKAPKRCFDCALKNPASTRGAPNCIACASLTTTARQDTCFACAKDFPNPEGCSACIMMEFDASIQGPKLNLQKTEACFDCVAAAGVAKRGTNSCAKCFYQYPILSSSDTSSCLQCASSSSYSPAASFGCYSCYAAPSGSRAGCLDCLKQFPASAPPAGSSIAASTGYRASTCGNCAAKEVRAVDFAAKNCYSCVAKSESSSYCSMMGQGIGSPIPASSIPLLPDYYKCLYQDSKITGQGTSCYSCLTMGGSADLSRKCFSCNAAVGGVNPGQASWCNNCWNGRAKNPTKCQTCLLSAKNSDGAYCSDK